MTGSAAWLGQPDPSLQARLPGSGLARRAQLHTASSAKHCWPCKAGGVDCWPISSCGQSGGFHPPASNSSEARHAARKHGPVQTNVPQGLGQRRGNASASQASSRPTRHSRPSLRHRAVAIVLRGVGAAFSAAHSSLSLFCRRGQARLRGRSGEQQKSNNSQEAWRSSSSGRRCKSASWLVRDCRSWARTKALEPTGTPSTTNPCASGGREPAPTQHDWSGKPEGWPCPLRSCERIRAIKESSYALACWQLGIGCSQRGMLPQ